MKIYCFDDFYKATVANWTRCETPDRPPDYVSFTGSAYWNCGNKVKRASDHWGDVRTCRWLLNFKECKSFCCGECFFDDFRPVSNLNYLSK